MSALQAGLLVVPTPTPPPSPNAATAHLALAATPRSPVLANAAAQKRHGAESDDDTGGGAPSPPLKRRKAIFGRRARAEIRLANATAKVRRQAGPAAYLVQLRAPWQKELLAEVMACLCHFVPAGASAWSAAEIRSELAQMENREEKSDSDNEDETSLPSYHPLGVLFYFIDRDFDGSGDGWLEGQESWGYVVARLAAVPREIPGLRRAMRRLALGHVFDCSSSKLTAS